MRSVGYVSKTSIEARAAAWLKTIRGEVAPRPQFALDPRRAALLVIDMLRYFADPDGRCYLPAAGVIVPRLAALLEAWRAAGAVVVFTRHAHAGPQDLGMLGKFFSDYIRLGEPDAEIVAALAPLPGEPVLRKTTYDAFQGTELAEILAGRGAEQVVVTGVLTHMCCDTTARAAFCRGYEVYMPVDGTASTTEKRHVNALSNLADSVAIVTSVAELIARCRMSRS